ncbi:MAG: NAD(P)/FAD-dependent oxidoreductase [Melioribacteraceae bacterium]|nr:NAD(P)/FAD-dependent oxidoreductase [Melioribacteraceae bacterium]
MKKYTVTIIGGGVAGLSCALTLASSKGFPKLPQDFSFLVIDDGKSDLKKARLYNVPLAENGIDGEELLNKLHSQIKKFRNTSFVEDTVKSISGTKGEFNITTSGEKQILSDYVVLATGMHKFEIAGDDFIIEDHDNVPKPGKIKLKAGVNNKIKAGVYAAGLAAGVPTMFACAAGSGVETACGVLSDIQENKTVIHDTAKSRLN